MAPTEYSQQFSAGFFARPCQHEYVRTVELSNLCSRDEATANWEGKKKKETNQNLFRIISKIHQYCLLLEGWLLNCTVTFSNVIWA